MLALGELRTLAGRLDGVRTLSAYVALPSGSPAATVRTVLRQRVALLREELTLASHVERTAFDACCDRLLARVDGVSMPSSGGTWAGFASVGGDTYDDWLPKVLPTMVAWDTRFRMAPYFTCIDQRAALVALVDRQHAALFRYDNGVVTSLESWATSPPAHTGSDLHTSAPPRLGFGRGTGGLPGADAAAREAETAADRHLAHVVNRIRALNRPAGWLVLLGAAEFVSHAASALEREMAGRLAVAGRLPVGATVGEVRAAAAPAIAHLRCQRTERLVADVLDHAHTPLSASGYTAVEHALADGAVRVLAIAERWLRDDAAAAEDLLRRALSCGADVAFVGGEAGAQLEEAAGGIAAELRFAATVPAAAVS